jgi:hypothetical protein
MAYANKIQRLTFSGTCFGGQEVWSTGLFIADIGVDIGTATQGSVDAYAALWKTFFQLSNVGISSSYLHTQTKLQVLSTAGVPDPVNTVYNNAITSVGAYGSNPHVPQAALVASLLSAGTHGLATKGRMFLPGVYQAVDPSTGRISSTAATNIATAFQTFINGINTAAPVGSVVALCSKGTTATPAGVSHPVSHVQIGNVFDTQRRRRNGLTETYVNKTIP